MSKPSSWEIGGVRGEYLFLSFFIIELLAQLVFTCSNRAAALDNYKRESPLGESACPRAGSAPCHLHHHHHHHNHHNHHIRLWRSACGGCPPVAVNLAFSEATTRHYCRTLSHHHIRLWLSACGGGPPVAVNLALCKYTSLL